MFIVASRDIPQGGELLLDYNLQTYWIAMSRIIDDHVKLKSIQEELNQFKSRNQNSVETSSTKAIEEDTSINGLRKSVSLLGASLWTLADPPLHDQKFKAAVSKLTDAIALITPFLPTTDASGLAESLGKIQPSRQRTCVTRVVFGLSIADIILPIDTSSSSEDESDAAKAKERRLIPKSQSPPVSNRASSLTGKKRLLPFESAPAVKKSRLDSGTPVPKRIVSVFYLRRNDNVVMSEKMTDVELYFVRPSNPAF